MTDEAFSGPQGRHDDPSMPARRSSPLFTRVSAAWVAIGASLLLLVLMIIFILQNSARINVHYVGLTFSLPLGMALVIAAVGGGVVVAIAGSARIAQLRRKAHTSEQPPDGSQTS